MPLQLRPLTGLIVLLFLALAGCQTKDSASLLFVQVAEDGRLLGDDDGDGWHELVLDRVSPQVIYFTDRPNRITGTSSLDEFMDGWEHGADSFEEDPPNAAMAQVGTDALEIVEIRRPVRNGTTLTYEARILGQSEAFSRSDAVRAVGPGSLGSVVLFIDNLTMSSSFRRGDRMNRTDNFGK